MTKKVPKTFFSKKTYFKVRSGTNGLNYAFVSTFYHYNFAYYKSGLFF